MRVTGTWIGLENGETGPIVEPDIADSWELANHVPDTEIEWTVSDDDSLDDDYVSVSRELFSQLWAIRSRCVCAARDDIG